MRKKHHFEEGVISYKAPYNKEKIKLNSLGVSGSESMIETEHLDILVIFKNISPSRILK